MNIVRNHARPTPGFHHLHLNSVDPDAAIDFYTRHFPSTAKTTWAGLPALKSPTNVLLLFSKVAVPPPTRPQTAIWHFGWHAIDSARAWSLQGRPDIKLLPLYTSDEGGTVFISSDTWPGTGGVLGLTKAQIADAKANGVQPTRVAGFGYMEGPDGAIIEFLGRFPAERFNHVHMFQEDTFCAQLWYQQAPQCADLSGPHQRTPLTEANCKVPRGPDPHLAGARARRPIPHAARRRRVRRCGADLVRAAGRAAAGGDARASLRPYRAQRRRPRRLDRQAARRGRDVSRTALSLGDTRRRDDRGCRAARRWNWSEI